MIEVYKHVKEVYKYLYILAYIYIYIYNHLHVRNISHKKVTILYLEVIIY